MWWRSSGLYSSLLQALTPLSMCIWFNIKNFSRPSDVSSYELYHLIGDRNPWRGAHNLFHRIRQKNLEANQRGDIQLESQFSFEEAYAKMRYNLGRYPGAFDPDSSYWIVPNASMAARHLGIDERKIILAVI